MTPSDFIRTLFAHVPPGVIEIRVIEDKKGGKLLDREFYDSPEALIADHERLVSTAKARNAAVFYGVLPRRARGAGKTTDALPGDVVWADLDFKDYAGGEAEARSRLEAFPTPPSIVVRSGHGLHVFWMLRDISEPSELSTASKWVAGVLGGDHTFDAARLLRLPGSFNLKDPENPIPVTIEKLDLDHRVVEFEVEALVADEASDQPEPPDEPPPAEIRIGDAISEAVQELLGADKKLNALFMGQGKLPAKSDGSPADCSSSGYDASLVAALIRKGVTDPSELATTLQWRPDGKARRKGRAYIERTVNGALAHAVAEREPKMGDFEITRIVIFDQQPTEYEVTVEGKTFRIRTPDLISPGRFRTRLADVLRRAPLMPEKWAEHLNPLLAAAERVQMPPEASYDPALAEAIEEAIDDLQVGEDDSQLREGKAWVVESGPLAGRKVFTTRTLLKRLKEEYGELTRGALCVHLRRLGYADEQLGTGTRPRVWGKSL